MQELQKVDIDLIRVLKRQGKYKEAWDLIEAHQNALKKNYYNIRKSLKILNQKCIRTKRKYNKLCVVCGNKLKNQQHALCESCLKKKRETNKNRKERAVEKNRIFVLENTLILETLKKNNIPTSTGKIASQCNMVRKNVKIYLLKNEKENVIFKYKYKRIVYWWFNRTGLYDYIEKLYGERHD